ncbi:SCO family protein [Tahibacter caeni]|uniref:SCO family protein n=1 Tax=Tahibacter caeni TaxID=1453545 RepID=UPI0021477CB4|nr:SCO family protein [Tahibacter caeni]
MGFRLTPTNNPHPSAPSVKTPRLTNLRHIAAAITFAATTAAIAITTTPASAAETSPEAAPSADTPTPSTDKPRDGAAIYLADLPLVDQNGKPVDLYNDIIAGRRIVLHSFFARCEGSCPVMMTTLQALQKQLGSRLGKDVHIVSITVDPDHDTPQVLADYARRVQAKPGWHFLSGSSAQVTTALRRIGQYTDAPENHMNLIIVGNDTNGDWRKVHGLAGVKQVVTEILEAVGREG